MMQSTESILLIISFFISSAVETDIFFIPIGTDKSDVVTKVTFAPLCKHISANECPIFPEDLLPINLTASIGSLVPPAEIKIFLPLKSSVKVRTLLTSLLISSKFLNRPLPIKPDAKYPDSGSRIITPFFFKISILFFTPK